MKDISYRVLNIQTVLNASVRVRRNSGVSFSGGIKIVVLDLQKIVNEEGQH